MESWFPETPWEKPIGSNYREAWKNGVKIAAFDSWREE